MTKWVIDTVELIRKQYVTDAYTKEAAEEKAHLQPPRTKVSLGEITHSVTPINEYEYNKDWKPTITQKDWVEEDIITSGKVRHKSEWVYAQQDGRLANRDRLKGPSLNEIW